MRRICSKGGSGVGCGIEEGGGREDRYDGARID